MAIHVRAVAQAAWITGTVALDDQRGVKTVVYAGIRKVLETKSQQTLRVIAAMALAELAMERARNGSAR